MKCSITSRDSMKRSIKSRDSMIIESGMFIYSRNDYNQKLIPPFLHLMLISVRENGRGHHEWTTQRRWQYLSHKTTKKKEKKTPQKTTDH
jgi:hypothetical protein